MSTRIHAISMPKWGMTMTEGLVADWLANEGDAVAADDDVIEIETTKITNVMEAHATGVLKRRVIDAGTTVPVGTLLGVIAPDDTTEAEIEAFISEFVPPELGEDDLDGANASRSVVAGPHKLNVLTAGDGGETLLLLHGFGGDLNSWLFNQPALAEHHTVHALDLPCHGHSSHSISSGSVPDLAQAVLAAADALGAPRFHLVGHSLGGAIALYLAMKHAERVASATLVCPGGLGPEINMAFIDGFVAADRRKLMKQALSLLFAKSEAVTRQMIEEALKYKRLDGVAENLGVIAAANFQDGKQAGGMRAGLAGSNVPMQVVWGESDAIIPATHAKDLPAQVAVHVIENAGHMPHMEQSRAFNALVARFVEEAAT
jgi:pyruvate dehydrogenase E2 component (dihydrolipoamide acetyltransferase)